MKKSNAFLIQVIGEENATWQGKITWLNQKETENFRSMLEMVRLIDTILEEESHAQTG